MMQLMPGPKDVFAQDIALTGSLALRLAGQNLRFEGLPEESERLLPERLMGCRVPDEDFAGRHIQIEMSVRESLRPPAGCHDLNLTSHLEYSSDKVSFQSDWCAGSFGIAKNHPVHIEIHRDSKPWFAGVLENLARLLTAYDILHDGGVMLHCAGLVKSNRASVLFGHSGAGKSTTSEIALDNGYSVISDDINIIEAHPDGWRVSPVPFSGTLNAMSGIKHPVPLKKIYRLHQSAEDKVVPCSTARAISLLAGSAPFINQDKYRLEQLVDVLTRLSMNVSVQDLYFTRGPAFLQHLA